MFLGIDLGTSSVKALLLTRDGRVAGEASAAYPVLAPRPGWAESEPAAWWEAAATAVRALVERHGSAVEGVGLSGQMHGVVLASASGAPLRPAVLWADGRARAEVAAYARLPAAMRYRLGNPPAGGMAGPTLAWLKAHEAGTYAAARWALQPKDWLRLRLTGVAAAEPSDASATLMYDLTKDAWADDVVHALGLRPDLLAPLMPSAGVAGTLTPAAAHRLGLAAGTPVAAGAADTAAAALGSGLVAPGPMQLTVGSGAQIVTLVEEARVDPSGRSHLFRTAQAHGHYAMAAMQNAGLALEWALRVLGVSWAEAYAAAFAVPAGAEGVTFLPYVTGERTPHFDPDAGGGWSGLRLGHGREHLLRAAFEGVAFSLRQGLGVLSDLGYDAESLRLAGGGTIEPAWRQLLADVLGRPLLATDVPSASARGAAIIAGLALGEFHDEGAACTGLAEPRLVAVPAGADPALDDSYARFLQQYPDSAARRPNRE